MLKKSNRIRSSNFVSILKEGVVATSPLFFVRIKINLISKQDKLFSVVVSKKIAKTAVKRNLIRRKVYSLLGEILKNPNLPGVKAVISVKKDISKEKLEIIKENLHIVLKHVIG